MLGRRYIHHDRVSGAFKKIAFQENDPRCIFCLIVVEWLHKELIPCPEIDRETPPARASISQR